MPEEDGAGDAPSVGARALQPSQPSSAAEHLTHQLTQTGLIDWVVDELVAASNCTIQDAETALEQAAADGKLQRAEVASCPCCDHELDRDELAKAELAGVCPNCRRAFTDCGSGIQRVRHFRRIADPGRSVPWVLVLHGMNTSGAWQEQLSWRMATTYGRSVPVFIYKYGKVVGGVFLARRRRALVRQLHRRIADLAAEWTDSPLGARPDVIAHSFGTWMLGHALTSTEPEMAGLAVGRVILVGSILRPDFPWGEILDGGRAEAVLNHYSHADAWASVSGFAIPDAGPSGNRGFDRTSDEAGRGLLINCAAAGFGHSDYFDPERMPQTYDDVWKPFLTSPVQRLREASRSDPVLHWTGTPRVLSIVVAMILTTLTALVLATVATVLILGVAALVNTLG